MLHLPLLISTLPGDRVVGEECLAVVAPQTLKEESSPSSAPSSEDEARGADLQLNLGSCKRSYKYYSNVLRRWCFLWGKAFLNGLCGPAIAGTPAGILCPPKSIPQTFRHGTDPRSRAVQIDSWKVFWSDNSPAHSKIQEHLFKCSVFSKWNYTPQKRLCPCLVILNRWGLLEGPGQCLLWFASPRGLLWNRRPLLPEIRAIHRFIFTLSWAHMLFKRQKDRKRQRPCPSKYTVSGLKQIYWNQCALYRWFLCAVRPPLKLDSFFL